MRGEWNQKTRGLPHEQANAEARKKFGSTTRVLEAVRDLYWARWFDDLFHDVKYAIRGWRRSPGFFFAVLATMAVGVGAATAIFSLVDPLLFRPLPYPHGEQLTSIGLSGPIDTNEFLLGGIYLDWRDHQTAFTSLTAMRPGGECDVNQIRTVRVPCVAVVWNFLRTLEVAPALGRDFTKEEDLQGAPLSVLVSDRFWRSNLGGKASALGSVVDVDGRKGRIIGILSKDFVMPQLGEADVMMPAQIDEIQARAPGSTIFLRAFARLKPGLSLNEARSRMMPLYRDALKSVPAQLRSEVRFVLQSLRDRQITRAKAASWLLLIAVLLLLGMACINVMNLLLARSEARREEFAMRAALGASRIRLLRQALTESLLFGLMGAVLGTVLAAVMLQTLKHMAEGGFMRLETVRLDARVMLFTLAASICCALMFGSIPALHGNRLQVVRTWRNVSGRKSWLRHSLVSIQIAFSLLLLTGALLFTRSLLNLESQAIGFRPEHLVAATVTVNRARYQQPERLAAFHNEFERRLRQLPGVAEFAVSDSLPPWGPMHSRPFSNILVAGHSVPQNGGLAAFRYITPSYFKTMGIPVLSGTTFHDANRTGQESSIVLSATLAKKLFGQENPLGQRLALGSPGSPWLTVIGVVADVKNGGLDTAPDPEYYRLRLRNGFQLGHSSTAIFRTSLKPASLGRWVQQQVAAIDSTVPVKMEVLSEKVHTLNDRPRFLAMVMGVFAAAALTLAGVGLYGVVSFLVTSRTREMGLRMALGATPRDIVFLIQKMISRWVIFGMAVGLLAELLAQRFIRGLLFGVSSADPAAIVVAVGALIVAAGIASWRPSLRAARVDPAISLRTE